MAKAKSLVAGSAYSIHSEETARLPHSTSWTPTSKASAMMATTSIAFCNDRDRREDRSQSSRYVSSDVIGYEELDDNGGWRQVHEYGTVGFPHTTIVGWAP